MVRRASPKRRVRREIGPPVVFWCLRCKAILTPCAGSVPVCASGHRALKMTRGWERHTL